LLPFQKPQHQDPAKITSSQHHVEVRQHQPAIFLWQFDDAEVAEPHQQSASHINGPLFVPAKFDAEVGL
jgi:hypothetical protein